MIIKYEQFNESLVNRKANKLIQFFKDELSQYDVISHERGSNIYTQFHFRYKNIMSVLTSANHEADYGDDFEIIILDDYRIILKLWIQSANGYVQDEYINDGNYFRIGDEQKVVDTINQYFSNDTRD